MAAGIRGTFFNEMPVHCKKAKLAEHDFNLPGALAESDPKRAAMPADPHGSPGRRTPPTLKTGQRLAPEHLAQMRALAATGKFDNEEEGTDCGVTDCVVNVEAQSETPELNSISAEHSGVLNDLPDYIRQIYSGPLGKKLTMCLNKIFNAKAVEITRNGRTFKVLGGNALEPQTMRNAPPVDDYSWSTFELGGGTSDTDGALGRQYSIPSKVIPGTTALWIFIANDISDMTIMIDGKSVHVSGHEVRQRTYVHELGNYLSAMIAKGDARFFGDPAGVAQAGNPSNLDYDTGANLERCVWGDMKP